MKPQDEDASGGVRPRRVGVTMRSEVSCCLAGEAPEESRETQPSSEDARASVEALSEQIRALESRLLSEQRFSSAILDSAQALLVVLDREGLIVRFNRACELLTGYKSGDVEGLPIWQILCKDDLGDVCEEILDLLCSAQDQRAEIDIRTKSGEVRRISWTNTFISEDGGPSTHLIGTGVDITELIRGELERDRLIESLQMSNTELVRANDELLSSEHRFRTIFDFALDGIILRSSADDVIVDANEAFLSLTGYSPEELRGAPYSMICVPTSLDASGGARSSSAGDTRFLRRDQRTLLTEVSSTSIEITGRRYVLDVVRDVSERRSLESQLRHSQKLTAVGELASGIAHEINTPMQFVGDNVQFLNEAFEDQRRLIELYRRAVDVHSASLGSQALISEIREAETLIDLKYLLEAVPEALSQTQDGLKRVVAIVRAMKEFAHPDQRERRLADINAALENTLTMARSEYKYVATVERELGELPMVLCHLGDVNQVFLNLIVNAAHAIGDVVGSSGEFGTIRVRTVAEGQVVRIEIEDTGSGIPEAIRDRIFEPFFTTKEVGRGSGQGLAIAHAVVVTKHQGTLTFDTELGKGTTFVIRLPIGVITPLGSSSSSQRLGPGGSVEGRGP